MSEIKEDSLNDIDEAISIIENVVRFVDDEISVSQAWNIILEHIQILGNYVEALENV